MKNTHLYRSLSFNHEKIQEQKNELKEISKNEFKMVNPVNITF